MASEGQLESLRGLVVRLDALHLKVQKRKEKKGNEKKKQNERRKEREKRREKRRENELNVWVKRSELVVVVAES